MEPNFYIERVSMNRRDQLKREMTLDLYPKRTRLSSFSNRPPVICSPPDLNALNNSIPTPVLDKLINEHGLRATTILTPTQILFPKHVTERQESYAKGFVDALKELHHSEPPQPDDMHTPPTYVTLSVPTKCSVIKEAPQTVPNISCSLPVVPIDMDQQELAKLERKRLRNRIAASKCRKRKLDKIAFLEERIKCLKSENAELTDIVNQFKEQINLLEEQYMDHVDAGCPMMLSSQYN